MADYSAALAFTIFPLNTSSRASCEEGSCSSFDQQVLSTKFVNPLFHSLMVTRKTYYESTGSVNTRLLLLDRLGHIACVSDQLTHFTMEMCYFVTYNTLSLDYLIIISMLAYKPVAFLRWHACCWCGGTERSCVAYPLDPASDDVAWFGPDALACPGQVRDAVRPTWCSCSPRALSGWSRGRLRKATVAGLVCGTNPALPHCWHEWSSLRDAGRPQKLDCHTLLPKMFTPSLAKDILQYLNLSRLFWGEFCVVWLGPSVSSNI